MTDEEILKVVRAAQAGRFDEIEQAFIHRDAPTPWIRMDGASLNFDAFVYRLKPKPIDIWIAAFKDGSFSGHFYNSKESCESNCKGHTQFLRAMQFREVIE